MQVRNGVETIDPDERKAYAFRFRNLDDGDTIVSAAWSVKMIAGVHESPEAILAGGESVDGEMVSQFIAGCLAGRTYRLICLVTTANGSLIELDGTLRCVGN